ncbi:MAG: hypothetical protein OEV40_11495, partial [Acidimicrobiia bacterium]|nr:hypothetical protein [Acidimicrobiia bacterium]
MERWRIVRISLAGAALLALCSAAAAGGRAGGEEEPGASLSSADRSRLDRVAAAVTVRVVGSSCEGRVRGSGFVVDGILYTSRHLVEGASTIAVA